ncbi:NAD(P)/FAD-dependent oxidoreductase [Actinospica durhamensis]|uniref:NAD(P)/FAD-dependent oxidoreductase n=1 Tax=Actinospica durhamensis TaxID=1508375 RepID=A0A941ISV5_9ACTN|nr:NAD(P)-binding domain-containing protein [Actinospica durhamensis]MBR7836847.1 NAD(P)/FAD-dependent oxidoreductase [Actinospica durhamensis]
MTTATDVLVLGAGPYGLSAYAHLGRHRLRTRIFGEPMRTWRSHMPAGMFLKSPPDASSIAAGRTGFSLEDYCRLTGVHMPGEHEAVPIALFREYGDWFARTLAPAVERTEVTSIARDGADGFAVDTGDGERFHTRAVVVASGLIGHAHTPPELRPPEDLHGAGLVSHSSEHDDLSRFAGRQVAVVGAGQSALESAALLAEAGARPTVVVRKPDVVFAGSPYDATPGGCSASTTRSPSRRARSAPAGRCTRWSRVRPRSGTCPTRPGSRSSPGCSGRPARGGCATGCRTGSRSAPGRRWPGYGPGQAATSSCC